MAPLAVFGITNDGLNLAVNLLLLFLVVLWLALVYWTHADAKRRIADPMLVTCATVAALFPFVGTIVYMVVRPPEFLEDVHERELEIAAAETRLPRRALVPALPELPAQAQGAVPHLRQATRPALADLPLLRGRGSRGGSRAAAQAPPRSARGRRRAASAGRASTSQQAPSGRAARAGPAAWPGGQALAGRAAHAGAVAWTSGRASPGRAPAEAAARAAHRRRDGGGPP